ncbi:MAG: hypothetical protein ACI9XO_000876 [Paraglaciecola sp.]|jgi:hypothetical protein
MSIPKEPRQLMINLMYLVLTALLALNVSAEVMNAFVTIDNSLKETAMTTDKALDDQQKALAKLLSEDSKKDFRALDPGIAKVRKISKDFSDYLESIKDVLIDGSGNKNGERDNGDFKLDKKSGLMLMKGKKNKDVTTRLLAQSDLGDELMARIEQTRVDFVAAYTETLNNPELAAAAGYRTEAGKIDQAAIDADIAGFADNISLGIDKDWASKTDKTSWKEYRFKQLPVLPATTLLTTFQSDAKNAEALAVGKLAEKAGGKEIVFDKFFPVINAKKAYVIKGDKFEAEVSLGAYSSDIKPENITLTVDGRTIPMGDDGVAKYSAITSSTGTKKIKLSARVKNPLTGEVSNEISEFEYEVGVRSATVSADKMNVFYIGVDNPVSVTVAGVSSNEIKVSGSGISMKKAGNGKYMVTASKPTDDAKITVSGGGLPATNFGFRVKRIPDPVARLSKSSGGAMGNGQFKAQGGVGAFLDNFDFEATCKIQGFNLVYVAKRQDPVEAINAGPRYGAQAKRLVNKAKPGDIYYYDNVKARCPGDPAGRKINSMVFKIK